MSVTIRTSELKPPVHRAEHRQRQSRHRVLGVLAASVILVLPVLVVRLPALRGLVYAAWLLPTAELALLAAGQVNFRGRYREAPGKFTELIIQVTTSGGEYERVTEIIEQIRDFILKMDYQIWVVTEPGALADFPMADRTLVVPADFSCRASRKARALEYSRRIRVADGFARPDVKILFVDDDVSLTQRYIERAFDADYDLCQGIVTPRTSYAVRPFGHFAASHADDIRTYSCLVYCSVFQGALRRPLHVHGEGLAVTGAAESLITWDLPLVASEDLAFGQLARRYRLRWGWFHEYVEITSPWSVRDMFTQRRRWLWGDLHAIRHRDVMPLPGALLVLLKYAAGSFGLSCSAVGVYLRARGAIPATAGILDYAKLSALAWVTLFFACGWVGASSAKAGRDDDSRLLSGMLAVLMMPVSVVLTYGSMIIALARGNPGTFEVIRKTR
jgi:hypothetical protein